MEDQARITDAVRQAADPLHVMQRLADQTCGLIHGADGALIALWDDADVLAVVCGAGSLASFAGSTLDVTRSLAGQALLSGAILRSDDTDADARVEAEESRRLGMRSMLCVPLARGRRTFGVMIVASRRMSAFDTADELVLRGLADFVGVVVAAASDLDQITKALLADESAIAYLAGESERQREMGPDTTRMFVASVLDPEAAGDLLARRRIQEALTPGAFRLVFQPIVDLNEGRAVGFEALARFPGAPARTPDVWFGEAHAVGLGVELELAAVELALSHQSDLPADTHLAVNVGPLTMTSPGFSALLARAEAELVVIELTEQAQIHDYAVLKQAISVIRATGARLAVDDTGAGGVEPCAHPQTVARLDQARPRAHHGRRPRSRQASAVLLSGELRR